MIQDFDDFCLYVYVIVRAIAYSNTPAQLT